MCYSDSNSTVQQIDSDKTQIIKNNIQIDNVQNSKNTIYNIDNVCMYRYEMCKLK